MKTTRAALYLRVSTDKQTCENQRIALTELCARRGWTVVATYDDNGVSGSTGRDRRPQLDALLKDAVRRRFDVVVVWSIDRLGRSMLHVTQAMADLTTAGVALYSEQQGIDGSTPTGRAMLQMATIFAELERSMIVARVNAGLDRARAKGVRLGRPSVPAKVERAIRQRLQAGEGMLKVAKAVGVGTSVVQRVKTEMVR